MLDSSWKPAHKRFLLRIARGAAARGTVEEIQILKDECPHAAQVKANNGWLPLHVAVRRGSLDFIQCLVNGCPDAERRSAPVARGCRARVAGGGPVARGQVADPAGTTTGGSRCTWLPSARRRIWTLIAY
jgi:hypothetical protein